MGGEKGAIAKEAETRYPWRSHRWDGPVEAFAAGRRGDGLALRVLVLALVAVAAAAVVAVRAAHFHGHEEGKGVGERAAAQRVRHGGGS